jgi:hypothetical protein
MTPPQSFVGQHGEVVFQSLWVPLKVGHHMKVGDAGEHAVT